MADVTLVVSGGAPPPLKRALLGEYIPVFARTRACGRADAQAHGYDGVRPSAGKQRVKEKEPGILASFTSFIPPYYHHPVSRLRSYLTRPARWTS